MRQVFRQCLHFKLVEHFRQETAKLEHRRLADECYRHINRHLFPALNCIKINMERRTRDRVIRDILHEHVFVFVKSGERYHRRLSRLPKSFFKFKTRERKRGRYFLRTIEHGGEHSACAPSAHATTAFCSYLRLKCGGHTRDNLTQKSNAGKT